jgi:hypothetical protein
LTENESKALERIFVCQEDKTLLEYARFIDEIELVFTRPVIFLTLKLNRGSRRIHCAKSNPTYSRL